MSGRDGLVLTMLTPFVLTARECAMQILANAQYVQRELPQVTLREALRERTARLCEALIGAKHDMITDLFELDEVVASEASDAVVMEWIAALVARTRAALVPLTELVAALDAEAQADFGSTLALVLVQESAGNVLQSFDAMYRAAEAVGRAVDRAGAGS